jgi:hypothetical protein
MLKLKLLVLVAIAAAIATVGAAWKWNFHRGSGAAPYRIAGWTWGDGPDIAQEQGNFRKLAHRGDDRDGG